MRPTHLLKILHDYPLIFAPTSSLLTGMTPIKAGNGFSRTLRPFRLLLCLFIIVLRTAPANSLTPPKPYALQIGDHIDVTVEGYPEYSKQIVVRLDGFISYPLIGEIKAEGLIVPQIEGEIRKGLADRLDNPRVFVTLTQSRQRSIYVWGAVKQANRYFFESEQIYLLQGLAMAGGPDYERAKLTEVQIWRDGKTYQIIDLTRLIRDGDQSDMPLQSDDVVYVPTLLQQRPIMVTGAVLQQGVYEIESPKIDALQALMMAGGSIQDIADLTRAQIIRSTGERVSINLNDASAELLTADIATLGPGDILHIPNAYEEEKVSIIGAVIRPGQYPIKKPIDLIEALALAGGWDQEIANLKEVLIIRFDGTKTTVNLLELLETELSPLGILLYPGDRLQVPERFKINWQAVLAVISAGTLIYRIIW